MPSTQASPSIVGRWAGEGRHSTLQADMVWVVQLNADGTFRADFRRYQNCAVVQQQVEEGSWQQEGRAYFVNTERIEGIPFAATSEYHIEELTSTNMKYLHMDTNTRSEARRLAADAGFPAPAGCKV